MDPSANTDPEYYDIFPYVRVFKDGTIQRLAGTEVSHAGLDPETEVLSKDILIVPEAGVSARLYLPNDVTAAEEKKKLPLVIYFHGGAFFISSAADPLYHGSLNRIAAEAKVVIVAVNYRLAPEHPLPAAYEDSWAALQWVSSHIHGGGAEDWLKDYADMAQVFVGGDSAGANIGHHLALRIRDSDMGQILKLAGIIMIHPYFWGKEPIALEATDSFRKKMVDEWWRFVCPSDKGNDDPLINPFVDGSPSLKDLACGKILVLVAGKDILRERGRLYHQKLISSGWEGIAEFVETEEEDHDFHMFNPDSDNAKDLVKTLAAFIKGGKE